MKTRMLALAVAALMLFAMTGCAQEEAFPLKVGGSGKARVVGHVSPPEGFAAAPELAVEGATPEYYFTPADPGSDVRFFYYTAGEGDPRALAETALASYGVFYDEFQAGEIREEALAGRQCLHFDYTCAYPDRSGARTVYEQTAIGYIPLDGESFVACSVSLAFDDASGVYPAEALDALLTQALSAVAVR